jgi:hypothetical protein
MTAKGDPFYPVVGCAAELKRAAPMQYEAFVKSVQGLVNRSKDDLLVAHGAAIFPAQGKAQALDQLAKKLEDCIQLDEQYRTRR